MNSPLLHRPFNLFLDIEGDASSRCNVFSLRVAAGGSVTTKNFPSQAFGRDAKFNEIWRGNSTFLQALPSNEIDSTAGTVDGKIYQTWRSLLFATLAPPGTRGKPLILDFPRTFPQKILTFGSTSPQFLKK